MTQQKPATTANRPRLSIPARNGIMIAVGLLAFAIVSALVLYAPIMYGDMIPNYGIIMMMTVPVIVGVATRVCLDGWLDR